MRVKILLSLLVASATFTMPAVAIPALDDARVSGGGGMNLPPFLQCVPYARQLSGIQIFGDAHTWWGQAEGRYARGRIPKVGAVMNFRPHGNSHLGHVAAVSRIIDSRTVLISHANWSPINGRRGQIENNVRAVDVSEDNDWSEVRVWFSPTGSLGTTHWPLYGFIYNKPPGKIMAKADKPIRAGLTPTKAERGESSPSRSAPRPAISSDPIGDIIRATQSRPLRR